MHNEDIIREIIKKVIEQTANGDIAKTAGKVPNAHMAANKEFADFDESCFIPDITEYDLTNLSFLKNPSNPAILAEMKRTTPARIASGRAGSRHLTKTQLRFRADHAAAVDAVMNEVSNGFIQKYDLTVLYTECADKDEFLTRPDKGRKLSADSASVLKTLNPNPPQVQIYISDGLSAKAVETNAGDCFKIIEKSLNADGIKVGRPFYVKNGRVAVMDQVSEITGAEVTAVLIGERPGLVTAESMSCYMAYRAETGMPESRRTVISNIHGKGTASVEAGAHIADIIRLILKNKASGTELSL